MDSNHWRQTNKHIHTWKLLQNVLQSSPLSHGSHQLFITAELNPISFNHTSHSVWHVCTKTTRKKASLWWISETKLDPGGSPNSHVVLTCSKSTGCTTQQFLSVSTFNFPSSPEIYSHQRHVAEWDANCSLQTVIAQITVSSSMSWCTWCQIVWICDKQWTDGSGDVKAALSFHYNKWYRNDDE